jgi:uncharacterized protein YyaL (SSP411 family)
MKHIAPMLAAALIASASAVVAAPPAPAKGQTQTASGVNWQPNLQAAHRAAVAENKPIMIVFGAEWCTYCKKLEKQTLNSSDVAHYINETFVPVHLDLDKEERVGDILEVKSLPCTIILTPNADLLGRIDGYYAPAKFQEKLTSAQQHFQQVQATAAAPAGVTR